MYHFLGMTFTETGRNFGGFNEVRNRFVFWVASLLRARARHVGPTMDLPHKAMPLRPIVQSLIGVIYVYSR
jgi:hypothetical protein